MSSRVLPRREGAPARPLAWRKANEGIEAAGAERRESGELQLLQARVAELEREVEQRVREAHEAGLREGEQAGRERERRELEPVLDRLSRSIREIAELRPALRRQAEEDVVRLALAVARRILHRELSVEPEALRGLVDAALERLKSQEICRARTHPEHVEVLRAALESGGRTAVAVLADPSCERGAAIFETGRGDLDASVGAQLREIGRGLADRLRETS